MRGLLLLVAAVVLAPPIHAQTGAAIYQRVLRRYPYVKPFVFGFENPSLAWFLPRTEWNRLTSRERAAVVEYMPVLVARARNNPDPYLKMPSTAPLYSTGIAMVQAFADGQWVIGVGDPTNSYAGRTLTMDTEVVCGPDVIADCDGVAASKILQEGLK
jgi:hypothetical protein